MTSSIEPTDPHDPYDDLIAANRDEMLKMHEEAVRRLRACLDPVTICPDPQVRMAIRILDALRLFHPMHGESWQGWPEGSEGSEWTDEDLREALAVGHRLEALKLREALEKIAELEGDCDNQRFKLTRFQAAQVARAALCKIKE